MNTILTSTIKWLIDNSSRLAYLIPILVAYAVYRFGLKAYYKQKEYELVRTRYLENTLDELTGHVEEAISAYRNNWKSATHLLRLYKNLGTIEHHEPIDKPFIRTQAGSFKIAAAYRLGNLLGHNVDFWSMYQLLFVFIDSSIHFFYDEFIPALRLASGKRETVDRDAIVNKYDTYLERLNKESYQYYELLTGLQTISCLLEAERLTFKTLKSFSRRKDVRASIARIQSIVARISESSENLGPTRQ